VAVLISLLGNGLWSWFGVFFVFFVIPLVEFLLGVRDVELDEDKLELRQEDWLYDWMLYLTVPVQLAFVWFYCSYSSDEWTDITWIERVGKVISMGIICGSFGINVAHELGHRNNRSEQFLAKVLLSTSLYMHFFIEHNRGHHKHVGTMEDPSTARLNETVYQFWFRSMWQTWVSAWLLERDRLSRIGYRWFSWRNEMLQFQTIQLIVLLFIYLFFGQQSVLMFWGAAFMGGIFLETINYIEHYGLQRKKLPSGHYEIVNERHSWNSNHLIGRLILFELSRHSDHHAKSHKKYQTLRSLSDAPQMPTGYPGMMVLSLIAPLWFRVMNGRVRKAVV
jgi:alkane 1-monooxygenase